jgi:acetate kinase
MKSHPSPSSVLTVNGGSSSIRFALYPVGAEIPTHSGRIDHIGMRGTNLVTTTAPAGPRPPVELGKCDHRKAVAMLLAWLELKDCFPSIQAIGHRVVHGMRHREPARLSSSLLAQLRRITPFDPDHLPVELALIDAFRGRHPKLTQVACFDTAFHRTMPRVATLLPLPRRYAARGIVRYGFHGLSYTYLLEELQRLGDPAARRGRVILAHLGNGASLAAVLNGKGIDTSMGFTPASGLVMGTRSGDLDPGLLSYLARVDRLSPARIDHLVNQESGLVGISGLSSDMRDLCARADTSQGAADAVDLFCYQAKKWIGAYAAALGGLDTLVFSGGIGENAPLIRARICDGLGFLGIGLEGKRNTANAAVISKASAGVKVRVIRTNEELMIARSVCRTLGLKAAPG